MHRFKDSTFGVSLRIYPCVWAQINKIMWFYNENRGQDFIPESPAKNTVKHVVSWILLDMLVHSPAETRGQILPLTCRRGASFVLQG